MTSEKILRFPRLDTVLMVENHIQNYDGEFKKKALWENLPKKMMYQTFCIVIDYLLYSKKISIDSEGKIGWIYYPENLDEHIKNKQLFWEKMKLPSKIRFSDEKVQEAFEKLSKSTKDKQKVHEWLIRAFEDIKENAFCGIQVPKRLIPKEYVKKYKVNNLWKYNLPNAWRLFYSVENAEIIVVSIVLEWMSHKDYEKKFKY